MGVKKAKLNRLSRLELVAPSVKIRAVAGLSLNSRARSIIKAQR